MRLIDADDFRNWLLKQKRLSKNYTVMMLDETPTVDPERHGKWIINTDDFTPAFRCTCCGYNKPMIAGVGANNDPGRYCQNCGAKMDGVDG